MSLRKTSKQRDPNVGPDIRSKVQMNNLRPGLVVGEELGLIKEVVGLIKLGVE